MKNNELNERRLQATPRGIGVILGLTRERVRQIEAETLANLALELDGAPRVKIQLRQGA